MSVPKIIAADALLTRVKKTIIYALCLRPTSKKKKKNKGGAVAVVINGSWVVIIQLGGVRGMVLEKKKEHIFRTCVGTNTCFGGKIFAPAR